MSKRRTSRKAARARKSATLNMDDLQDMIDSAVKNAMDGQKNDDGDEDEEKDDGDLEAILEDALTAVSEKSDVAGDDADDLIDAVLDAVEGKSDDEDVDLVEMIEKAAEAVNEKRKSAKTDGLPEGLVEDVIDAVAEVMSDGGANEEGKRRKSAASKRQVKNHQPVRTAAPTRRKYSNFYMSSKGESTMDEKKQKEVPANIQLARAVKCLDVFGRNDPDRAAFYAKKHYQDAQMEKEFKALSATSPSGGGFLIPEIYSDQIIELLYPKTVIVDLGAQTVPLTNGNLTMPKMTAGSRARWGGEQRKIKTTQPAFGNIKLSAKRLEAIVPQSRELIMSTNFSADAMFANDLMRRMQLGLDYGGLYGTGGEFQPLGIAFNKGIQKIDATQLSNADLADPTGKITADFPVYIRSIVLAKNVDDTKAGWAMNSMLEGYFMNLKTTTGAYIYREEMQSGKLLGFPYKVSNQIPTTSDGYTDLFFGNWADLLIGDQMGLETYTALEGSWTDEDGIQHNAFEENLAATRALMYDDIGVRHEESFVYCKKIKVY